MNYMCQFVGGRLHGASIPVEKVQQKMAIGFSEDLSEIRKRGGYVHRAELDNQPLVSGYLSPMWDGVRNIGGHLYGILRYETQEIYDMLSR